MNKIMSYEKSGVNIDIADATKKEMASSLATDNIRVLNKLGAFASLYDFNFSNIKHPVIVLKTEEPGSKQKLAFQYNKVESICYDMINHLVNDIIVMGATPLTVQDAIICGKIEKETVKSLVSGIASACKSNECVLTGGETSEQPGVVEKGMYILTSSIVGVVEKENVIDGSKIKENDILLAVESNGIHTNGYSLIRMLIENDPSITDEIINGEKFIDIILKPHKAYYKAFKGLFLNAGLHGMAHITGGGIQGNLGRIFPTDLDALVDLSLIRPLPIFKFLKKRANVSDDEMLKTFNMGVGMILVVDKANVNDIIKHLNSLDCNSYIIGVVKKGNQKVEFENNIEYI